MDNLDSEFIARYSEQVATQMRKGLLGYFILLIAKQPVYTSEIITRLREAEVQVVEGTIYPLLSRLHREGLLSHQWQESPAGPPRKYYQLTAVGEQVLDQLHQQVAKLNNAANKLGENNEGNN